MMKKIIHDGELLGIIVRNNFYKEGIEFFTDNDLSQQLAFMSHSKGHSVQPHCHNQVPRIINYTQETLFIRKGKIRLDFYNSDQKYVESHFLGEGDVVLLVAGGHGFEVLENLEMFEVKQGPYIGDRCKCRFTAIPKKQLKIIE